MVTMIPVLVVVVLLGGQLHGRLDAVEDHLLGDVLLPMDGFDAANQLSGVHHVR